MEPIGVGANEDLTRQGYVFLSGEVFLRHKELSAEFAEFRAAWTDLPPDPYITDGPVYRLRRHARAEFNASVGEIRVLPPGAYLQSASDNPLFGGIRREFSPIGWSSVTDRCLRALVVSTGGDLLQLYGRHLVNLHMVRIVGTAAHPGQPAPEGPHRDGFDYISVHMIGWNAAGGGLTSVLDEDGKVLGEGTLNAPLDAIVVDDRRLKHYTSPIETNAGEVYRDVLLMSFEAIA